MSMTKAGKASRTSTGYRIYKSLSLLQAVIPTLSHSLCSLTWQDMQGMGKTIQAISVIVTHRNDDMSANALRPMAASAGKSPQQPEATRPKLKALARTEALLDHAPSGRIGMLVVFVWL